MKKCSWSSAILVAGALLLAPAVARADKILIYQTLDNDPQGGDGASAQAEIVLSGLGHDVTRVASLNPTLPDLADFDTAWFVQLPRITGAQVNALLPFVNGGGGLFITGENPCCESQNTGDQELLANLIRGANATVGGTAIQGGDSFLPTSDDPFGITSTPNQLGEWKTQAAGLVSWTHNPPRTVFENAAGNFGAIAVGPEDLKQGSGCVFLAMDLTFWQENVNLPADITPFAENVEQFLKTCADTDGDGISDEGEDFYGTDPADPDGDDDGLCDGFGAAPGACVSGEHPADNYDEDDLANPFDPDDDNDGIPTSIEVQWEGAYPDLDGDLNPTWADQDSDQDGFDDRMEGLGDYDGDGTPAAVDDDDYPTQCATDDQCLAIADDLLCNLTFGGFCNPGCRNGQGCAAGLMCSSNTDDFGLCLGDMPGGGGSGGSGGATASGGSNGSGGSSATAGGSGPASGGTGNTGDAGSPDTGDAGNPASGGAIGTGNENDDGGCGCRVATESSSSNGVSWLALLALAALRRRRALTSRVQRRAKRAKCEGRRSYG